MRMIIAEDGALFREGLTALLRGRGHTVIAALTGPDDLEAAVSDLAPDIVVIDIRMPSTTGADGADAALALRRRDPALPLLLLSQHVELRRCRPLFGSPGFGYLLKDSVLDVDEFDDALHRIAGGGTALDPALVRALVQESEPTVLDRLSTRELDVLGLVAQGLSNASIAEALHLSGRTVETHMRTIFLRLGLLDDPAAHRRVLAVLAYFGVSTDSRVGSAPNRGWPAGDSRSTSSVASLGRVSHRGTRR